MLNARQQVWVSRVLWDDHYKRMPLVTVGVARWRTFTDQWPWVLNIGQNLQTFTCNGDVSIWVKNSWVGWKITNKQTNTLGAPTPFKQRGQRYMNMHSFFKLGGYQIKERRCSLSHNYPHVLLGVVYRRPLATVRYRHWSSYDFGRMYACSGCWIYTTISRIFWPDLIWKLPSFKPYDQTMKATMRQIHSKHARPVVTEDLLLWFGWIIAQWVWYLIRHAIVDFIKVLWVHCSKIIIGNCLT